MTAPFLGDALGPRGRRRVWMASVVAAVALVALVAVAFARLEEKGQLDANRWEPFTQASVLRYLLTGLGNTVRAALVAMTLSVVLGGLLALGRLARNRAVRWVTGAYVDVFRALPVLLMILFAFLGLPLYGVRLSIFWALVVALVAYNGAVLGEIFRAGILSLDRGQSDAARAIGLGYWGSMAWVIVPQAARRMVPAIVSQLVTVLKDTSLGYVIGYEELLRRAEFSSTFFGNTLQSLTVVAAVYIVVNFALSRLANRLEVRQRRRYRASGIGVAGVEDLAVITARGPADS